MKLSRWNVLGAFLLAATLSLPQSLRADTRTNSALPGTVNYVEGQASIGADELDAKSIGSAQLQAGQGLATENGKVELLLTPGVFVRLDSNSAVRMISPSITDTQIGLDKGRAMIEVADLHPENDIRVQEGGVTTRLIKTGLYEFDADRNQVRVFDGQAEVQQGDKDIKVKGGRELALNDGPSGKAVKFDKDEYKQSDLYRWSSLRSSYLAEANVSEARVYVANGWYGPGWIGAGWYWNPWFGAYTFIPGAGFYSSPFGWGFYSPLWVSRAPGFYVGGYRHFGPAYRPGAFVHAAPLNGFHGSRPAWRGNMSGGSHGFAGGGRMGRR